MTLETLANGQLIEKLEGITSILENNNIVGKYKNYNYTIDEKFVVTIGDPINGEEPTGRVELLTTNYMFDGEVEIKLTASIKDGNIVKIKEPEDTTLKTEVNNVEKIYTVNKNGTYTFTIIADNGNQSNVSIKVENILAQPEIVFEDINIDSFKIVVNNNYPENAIAEYKYYVENELKKEGTRDNSYIVTNLNAETEYKNIKVIAYTNTQSKESELKSVTTSGLWSENYENTRDYVDEYGNIAKIPAGFQVSEKIGEKNLTEGLVVRDATTKNEFVWIPVGKIYTDRDQTEENAKKIDLNRYTFDSTTGKPTPQGTNIIGTYYNESQTTSVGNKTAKNIDTFVQSVKENKGYYIGRYEAGDLEVTESRKSGDSQTHAMGVKKNLIVYDYITQVNAANLARDLYNENAPIVSDLANSYAWDTALVFVQELDDRKDKSKPYSLYGPRMDQEKTGLSDEICNIFNMGTNAFEWSTENCEWPNCRTMRGGCGDGTNKAGTRNNWSETTNGYARTAFRPILYF